MSELHVLVVDDDPQMRDRLCRYLEDQGFAVSVADGGKAMRRRLAEHAPDLILLDLMMPGEDGLMLTRWLRSRSQVPIIMLTNKGEVVDRIVGLEVGADDYLPKPFDLRELLARIRAVVRRTLREAAMQADAVVEAHAGYRFDGWVVYRARRELRAPGGETVALTTAEFDLLVALVENANRVVSRDRLMDLTKGRQWSAYDRAIDNQVLRLRKKVESDPRHPNLIKSVRGIGYMFTAEVQRIEPSCTAPW